MTALRNRQHLIEGKDVSANNRSNHNMGNGITAAKKKLVMLEEEVNNISSDKHNNSNNNNNIIINNNYNDAHSDEETFADAHTVGAHPKLALKEDDEQVPIFAGVFGSSGGSSSIGQTVRDQFAVALLKLQTDLDSTSKRLEEVESKVDTLNKHQKGRFNSRSAAKSDGDDGFFGKRNLMGNLVYLSWPFVVFLAMRAIERRSSLANKLA